MMFMHMQKRCRLAAQSPGPLFFCCFIPTPLPVLSTVFTVQIGCRTRNSRFQGFTYETLDTQSVLGA